ncbi:MAG TPA: hypothetical protein VLE49_03100, partial [Anaerolineales bacterium]|nr:hypothetical protein [Anaerolineales bacterium]
VILYSGAKKYFVTMPETYPPSFEDYVSWVALRAEKPSALVYLGSPLVAHRVAYFVNTKMVPHTFLNVDFNSFSPQAYAGPGVRTILFWEANTQQGYEYLQQVPHGFGTPVAFHDISGNIFGYAATNSPEISLESQAESSRGWNSLAGTPAQTILLLLLAGILVAGVYGLRGRFSWPHLSFRAEQQDQEGTSDTAIEKSDTFDVEFSFRIRISPRKQNRP